MQELFAHIMITAVTAIMAVTAMEVMNFLLKRRIIKSGRLDQNYLELLTKKSKQTNAFKWGILALFAGLGLIVIGCLPFDPEKSPIPWGVELISIGIGFLVYYMLTLKNNS